MNGTTSKMRAAAMGGLALGAASAVPVVNFLNCACCSLVLLGGVLSAYLYLRNLPPSAEPPWGDVAIVGLFAGLIGAAVTAVLSLPFAFFGMGAGMYEAMQETFAEADLPEPFRNMIATAGSGTLALGMIGVSFLLNLFVYALFSTLGALLGAALFGRRTPTAPATPYAPPPPPPPPAAPTY